MAHASHIIRDSGGHMVKASGTGHIRRATEALYATFAGLAGDLATFNGKQSFRYFASCVYFCDHKPDFLNFSQLEWDGANWEVHLIRYGTTGCGKLWRRAGGGPSCDPAGSYAEVSCDDTWCADGTTCANSVGATCVVSCT
jgi:hypothetical protein